jgi:DNA repair exonuclease SbcCD ATPase subunit
MLTIESRRSFVEDLHRNLADLGALGGKLDERGRELQTRMGDAEQRFQGLAVHAEETARLGIQVANLSTGLDEAGRMSSEVAKTVAAVAARCASVETLAEKTRALKAELDQRQQALTHATKDLERASASRKQAAGSAQRLEELANQLTGALSTAEQRLAQVGESSARLDDRVVHLRSVEKRLGQFEARLAKWDPVEKEIARSLEQIAARQSTVEALKIDLDRMFVMAETTAAAVREITSAHQEIDQSRALLEDVRTRLQEIDDVAEGLDERKRQMTKAEERLARADALLVDVRSSLEALQGEKEIVDQAVEKAGSLQILLKQAEATIEGLREERELTARVRAAVAVGRQADEAADGEDVAKAA